MNIQAQKSDFDWSDSESSKTLQMQHHRLITTLHSSFMLKCDLLKGLSWYNQMICKPDNLKTILLINRFANKQIKQRKKIRKLKNKTEQNFLNIKKKSLNRVSYERQTSV